MKSPSHFFELAKVADKTLTTSNDARAIVKIDQKKITPSCDYPSR